MALLCLWLARAAARMAQPRRPEFQLAHALYVHNNLVVKGTAGRRCKFSSLGPQGQHQPILRSLAADSSPTSVPLAPWALTGVPWSSVSTPDCARLRQTAPDCARLRWPGISSLVPR